MKEKQRKPKKTGLAGADQSACGYTRWEGHGPLGSAPARPSQVQPRGQTDRSEGTRDTGHPALAHETLHRTTTQSL